MRKIRQTHQLGSVLVGRKSTGFRNSSSNVLTPHQSNDFVKPDAIVQDSGSVMTNFDEDPVVSDCESGICGSNFDNSPALRDGLIRLEEEEGGMHGMIKRRFLSGLGSLAAHATVVDIHKNPCSSFTGQAKRQSFRIFSQALGKKNGGHPNLKYAWYAASKEDVPKVITHGFGECQKTQNSGFGSGIYLAPDDSSIESVKCASIDSDGLRHVMLCRVLLGNPELVHCGSVQSHPSSEEFDSGIDSFEDPKKYIIWSTHMNTHIIPDFVISFRAPLSVEGFIGTAQGSLKRPSSPWMPFPALIAALSKYLPPDCTRVIVNYYNDFRAKKISRNEFIQQARIVAGDKLLTSVIKSSRVRQYREAPPADLHTRAVAQQNTADGATRVFKTATETSLARMSSHA